MRRRDSRVSPRSYGAAAGAHLHSHMTGTPSGATAPSTPLSLAGLGSPPTISDVCRDCVARQGTPQRRWRRHLWVPIIRSWALTRGFALHPGTSNRYEIRYTRTQHRPASRQVNDHGRVSGTRRPPLPLSDPGATNQVKPEAPHPRRGDDRGVEQFEPRLGARLMP